MANSTNSKSECGPFICCGAAGASFSHQAGEPTCIDNFFTAVKRISSRTGRTRKISEGTVIKQHTAVAHSYHA